MSSKDDGASSQAPPSEAGTPGPLRFDSPAPASGSQTGGDASEPSLLSRAQAASLGSHRRRRLPQDVIGKLQDEIFVDPRNPKHWLSLVNQFRKKDKADDLRNVYERALKIFPCAAQLWIDYLNLEQSQGELVKAEQIFARCLLAVPDTRLYKYYIDYVRRVNNIGTHGQEARNTILQAFEFAVKTVGIDPESGPIWAEYLNFVKTGPATSTWEQAQRMDHTRRVYQQAICIPLQNLETLWSEYNQFENSVNRSTARKFTAEHSPNYMLARSKLREWQNMTVKLDRYKLPSTSDPSQPQQLAIWKNWINWEKDNPLDLKDDAQLTHRITFVYKQASMPMRFAPEIWFDAAQYAQSLGQDSEPVKLLTEGINACPISLLLTAALSETNERNKRKSEARTPYDTLIANQKKELETIKKRAEDEVISLTYDSASYSNQQGDAGENNSKDTTLSEQTIKQINNIEDETEAKSQLLARDITITMIMQMRMAKRTDGIKAARQVFGEARKLPYATYHIYIASAHMEYHHNKDSVIASKIFEIGMKRFQQNVKFVSEYLSFLISINDDTNARALFERTVQKISPTDAFPLYEKFYDYECESGVFSAILKLQERISQVYPSETSLDLFAKRYSFMGVDPITETELAITSSNGSAKRKITLTEEKQKVKRARMKPNNEEPFLQTTDNVDNKDDDNNLPLANPPQPPKDVGFTGNPLTARDIPEPIINLLSRLPPNSSYSGAPYFNSEKLVKLIRDTNVPENIPSNVNLTMFKGKDTEKP